jgi:hypothetical protein
MRRVVAGRIHYHEDARNAAEATTAVGNSRIKIHTVALRQDPDLATAINSGLKFYFSR